MSGSLIAKGLVQCAAEWDQALALQHRGFCTLTIAVSTFSLVEQAWWLPPPPKQLSNVLYPHEFLEFSLTRNLY